MAVAGEVAVVAAAVDVAKAVIGTIIIRQRIEKPRHYIFFLFSSWAGPRVDIIGRRVFVNDTEQRKPFLTSTDCGGVASCDGNGVWDAFCPHKN